MNGKEHQAMLDAIKANTLMLAAIRDIYETAVGGAQDALPNTDTVQLDLALDAALPESAKVDYEALRDAVRMALSSLERASQISLFKSLDVKKLSEVSDENLAYVLKVSQDAAAEANVNA